MQTLSTNSLINLKNLYKSDYLAWYEVTLEQIKNNQLTSLNKNWGISIDFEL